MVGSTYTAPTFSLIVFVDVADSLKLRSIDIFPHLGHDNVDMGTEECSMSVFVHCTAAVLFHSVYETCVQFFCNIIFFLFA